MPELMRLTDGRTLAYEQWGSPDGLPVVHLHGTPSSRLERYPDEAAIRSSGIRLITFDRPGYGASDPRPGLTLADGATDVIRLADHLGLGRFALQAMSGGGPYLLACAWAAPRRVVGAAILAGLGPLDRISALAGMHPLNAMTIQTATQSPDQLADLLAGDGMAVQIPAEERPTLSRIPGLVRMMLRAESEASRQGPTGAVDDYRALVAPWPFPLSEVAVRIRLWHGDRDTLVPIHHSEYLADRLGAAELVRCADEGHFAMIGHRQEILGFLASCFAGDQSAP